MLGICHGKLLSNELEKSAYISKIGGCPRFHINPSNDCLIPLICSVCCSSNRIVFVAQIFAPIPNMDRSLYIFCCNSRKCSLKSEAWIVYRNQAIETITPTTKTNETKAIPVPSQTPLNTIWSGLGSNQTNSAADVTFDDLESLLMARDEVTSKSQTTIKKKNPTIPTATISTTTTSLDHSDHSNLMGIKWPAWSISEELEQVLFEDAEEGADVDDEHTREAYQRYLAEEEDRELVNMLTHGVTAGNISSQENMHFEDDESEEAPSLVENSAAEAVELEFQKRCALQPRQVN